MSCNTTLDVCSKLKRKGQFILKHKPYIMYMFQTNSEHSVLKK